MPAHVVSDFAPLPKSHYFFTVSRGTGMRTFAVRIIVVQALVCVLPLLGLIGCASTAYIVFHDDVVASLMARQGDMQYAYEDRLDALRGELRRQTMRDTADRAAIEARVHELLVRENKLESRADLMKGIADITDTTPVHRLAGPASGIGVPAQAFDVPAPTSPVPASSGFAPSSKPRPIVEPAVRPTGAPSLPDSLSAIDPAGVPLLRRLDLAKATLDDVEQSQVTALRRIGSTAREETSRFQSLLDDIGLSSERFRHATASDQGGPFVPLPADRDSPFGQAMIDLQDTIVAASRLRGAIGRIPLADPLPGPPEITSPFGARVDPFLGRAALHTGVDLRESFGTEVRATAAGRVSFAGFAGGYGNMVEVDHGNGLVSRYAHMEQILIANGQPIEAATIVGLVGSTGRATGPHLHYEVRVDNEPVDPMRYLNAGVRFGSPR